MRRSGWNGGSARRFAQLRARLTSPVDPVFGWGAEALPGPFRASEALPD
jgi:hypothetical protein